MSTACIAVLLLAAVAVANAAVRPSDFPRNAIPRFPPQSKSGTWRVIGDYSNLAEPGGCIRRSDG